MYCTEKQAGCHNNPLDMITHNPLFYKINIYSLIHNIAHCIKAGTLAGQVLGSLDCSLGKYGF